MITIHFHGHLKQYGEQFQLDVETPAEAVKALCTQIAGLAETIKAGNWHVLRGKLEDMDDDSEESLTVAFGEKTEMHLIPAIEGAGDNGGLLTIIAGIALIMIAPMFASTLAYSALMGAGIGMTVGGVIMAITAPPTAEMNQEEDKASFLFNKPVNTSKQGVPIPRGYGRMKVGSTVVSTSLTAEQIQLYPPVNLSFFDQIKYTLFF